jgi:hypothetical protein
MPGMILLRADNVETPERDAMYKIAGAIMVAALVIDFIWVIRTALSTAGH